MHLPPRNWRGKKKSKFRGVGRTVNNKEGKELNQKRRASLKARADWVDHSLKGPKKRCVLFLLAIRDKKRAVHQCSRNHNTLLSQCSKQPVLLKVGLVTIKKTGPAWHPGKR